MTVIVAASLVLGAGTASGRDANTTVAITQFGFVPESVAVQAGDTVVWENRETVPHRVVADDGSFVSPMLGPG
ncbi:MAG TPA: plastocyanin/azurin family copper-binding protein, partial [Gaiellaceae bacterium]|nr:plastocyanin/azurin family copper-binding protein [Gaiellaceae bacterium]